MISEPASNWLEICATMPCPAQDGCFMPPAVRPLLHYASRIG